MSAVRVLNVTRGTLLAERAELADHFWSRFAGLMGRARLPVGGGLVLRPGGPIHTCFMRMPLDVLHVDERGRVSHVLHGVRPWRLGPLRVAGHATIELPAGAAEGTQPGDVVAIEPQPPSHEPPPGKQALGGQP